MNKYQVTVEKKRFKEAVSFLKKTKVHHQDDHSLFDADWYLWVGTAQSGKTTLLKNSEQHFYLSKKNESSLEQDSMSWWVTKNATYLDFSSQLLKPEKKIQLIHYGSWLKQSAPQNRLAGVFVVVSVKDIVQADLMEKKSLEINELLAELTRKFSNPLPVYLLINKMDLLSGFEEFFSALAKDERQQAWGARFSGKGDLHEELSHELDYFLKKLNGQLIHRLHHEPDLEKRVGIKDFPVQFAYIKNPLIQFIEKLTLNWKKLYLSGFYFSAVPKKAGVRSGLPAVKEKQKKSKAYFIHDLLSRVIELSEGSIKIKKKQSGKEILYYIIFFGIILSALGLFVFGFINHQEKLKEVDLLLQSYRSEEALNDASVQPEKLKHLAKANELLNRELWWEHYLPGARGSSELAQSINKQYQRELNRMLVPSVKETLEATLISSQQNPALLYASLKCYLMLANPLWFDKAYFYEQMSFLWSKQSQSGDGNNRFLLAELKQVLDKQILHVSINYSLVNNARQNLMSLTPEDLANAILRSHFISAPMLTLNLAANEQASRWLLFKNPDASRVSSFYTEKVYQQLKSGIMQDSVKSALMGDAVIGVMPEARRDDTAISLLTTVQQDYLISYAKAWQEFIDNLQFKSFSNLSDLSEALSAFDAKSSFFQQLISLLSSNIPPEVRAVDDELSSLTALQDPKNKSLQNLKKATANLAFYLKDSSDKTIFYLAKERMLNRGQADPITDLYHSANEVPEPLQSWFSGLAENAWQLMLIQTSAYIQKEWNERIGRDLSLQIKNRYPFDPNASMEVSLTSFEHFFSPAGLFDQFFMAYLEPFVSTDQEPWQFKSLDNGVLSLKSSFLKQQFYAFHLKNIFFPAQDGHVFFSFSLQPVHFSETVYAITIQLGTQQAVFYNNKNNLPITLRWPDENNQAPFKITFYHTDKTKSELSFPGLFGFWRFIRGAEIKREESANTWSGFVTKDSDTFSFKITAKALPKFYPLLSGI